MERSSYAGSLPHFPFITWIFPILSAILFHFFSHFCPGVSILFCNLSLFSTFLTSNQNSSSIFSYFTDCKLRSFHIFFFSHPFSWFEALNQRPRATTLYIPSLCLAMRLASLCLNTDWFQMGSVDSIVYEDCVSWIYGMTQLGVAAGGSTRLCQHLHH